MLKTAGLLMVMLLSSGVAFACNHEGGKGHGDKPCVMQLGKPCPMMKKGEPCPMHDGKPCTKMLHGKHGKAMKADMNEGSRALVEATAKMHAGMDIAFSGDVDIDFLRGMIAHHQGAVEMAQVQLKFGKDAQVRRLAQEIIRAQNLEIRWMQNWLKQLEAKQAGYSDQSWSGKTWLGER